MDRQIGMPYDDPSEYEERHHLRIQVYDACKAGYTMLRSRIGKMSPFEEWVQSDEAVATEDLYDRGSPLVLRHAIVGEEEIFLIASDMSVPVELLADRVHTARMHQRDAFYQEQGYYPEDAPFCRVRVTINGIEEDDDAYKHRMLMHVKRQQFREQSTPEFAQDWADTALKEAEEMDRLGLEEWVATHLSEWQALGHDATWIQQRINVAAAQTKMIHLLREKGMSRAAIRSLLAMMGKEFKNMAFDG